MSLHKLEFKTTIRPDQHKTKANIMHGAPPPLQLLSTFEAAARLQSFKKAGDELHVTPSAISQQIKLLEDHLGLLLFNRLTRKVELTEAGQAYFNLAEQTLSTFKAGHHAFFQRFSKPAIRLSVVPFVAFEIIIPSLHEFHQLHPDIELRLETSMTLVDFDSEPVDAAIRFGEGPWPGLETLPLADCKATLVASPALLAAHPIQGIGDLANHTLIHTRGSHNDWTDVAKFIGMKELKGKRDLILDCYLAAMSAAEKGLGIAICLLPLTNAWLTPDRLIALAPPLPLKQKHFFLMRNDQHKRQQMLAVYEWVKGKFDALKIHQHV